MLKEILILLVSPFTFLGGDNITTVSTETTVIEQDVATCYAQKATDTSNGSRTKLTKSGGVYYFGKQKETYYNLPMEGVVSIMRNLGYSEEEYPYHVREDGVKMFGDYIMIAADLNIHERGSLVETSLGMGIVCDTGTFAKTNHLQVDIAVEW